MNEYYIIYNNTVVDVVCASNIYQATKYAHEVYGTLVSVEVYTE